MYEDSRPSTREQSIAAPNPNRNVSLKTKTKPNILRTSHSLALSDLRARWRRGLLWTAYLAIVLIFVFALTIAISTSAPANKPKFDDSVACLPDGRFSVDPGHFNFWGAGGFFEITMGYGQFTFTEAKAIDVAWDVVVGRGGQALLALISGDVFARYVTSTMAVAPVTFNTFRTIFLQRDANTAMGLTRLVGDFVRRKSLSSRAATVFMVLSMVFVLIFPTFVSSMSGYSANVQAFVEDQSERYVPFSDFTHLYYTIHDGEKIGLPNEYRITGFGEGGEPLLQTGTVCEGDSRRDFQEQCDLLEDVTNYILDYGTEQATNNDTTFGRSNKSIGAPSLNITAHHIPYNFLSKLDSGLNSNNPMWEARNPRKILTPSGRNLDLLDQSLMAWIIGARDLKDTNTTEEAPTYDHAYIKLHGRCQPSKTYKWGFSFIQLFIMVVLLTCWSIGTYVLYIRAHIAMLKRGHSTPIAGEYQAVFQLADAMDAQLDQEPESVEKTDKHVLGEEQLRQRIKNDLKGGSISYKDSLLHNQDANTETRAWRTRDWIKKEIWWLCLLAIAVVGCFVTAWFVPYVVAPYLLPLQVLFAMYVGQTGKSRVVLFAWMVVVLGVVPTVVTVVCQIGVRRQPR